MSDKTCPECGDNFNGRTDKKFCGDYCRNTYNNRINSDANRFMRNVNHILRKNRRILESLFTEGNKRVTAYRLLRHGFDFGFHTGTCTTIKGTVFRFCYEYGYARAPGDRIAIVKRKELPDDGPEGFSITLNLSDEIPTVPEKVQTSSL